MHPEETLNRVINNIPTYFSVTDYIPNKLVTMHNFMNNKKYALLTTPEHDYKLSTHLEVATLQQQGYIVSLLPIETNYQEKKVSENPRYDRRNYQNIQEDFGNVDFSNFYSTITPIRIEPFFPLNEKTLLNQYINNLGELELFIITRGTDRDGERADLYNVQRILQSEIQTNKWTLYTLKDGSQQQALIGPINNEFLKKHFYEHTNE